jgi:hypothetical protein
VVLKLQEWEKVVRKDPIIGPLIRFPGLDGGKSRNIEWWDGYGVVCPDIATTNGSMYFMIEICHPDDANLVRDFVKQNTG